MFAQKVLLERDFDRQDAAAESDRNGWSHGKLARYLLGHSFDQQNQEAMLKNLEFTNLAQGRVEAVSTHPQNPETINSIAVEI